VISIAHALSFALLHFVWQGLLVALLLRIVLLLLSKRSAHTRYLVSCAALALLAALPIITARVLYEPSVQEHTSAKATATAAQTASPLAPASVSQMADAAPSGPGPLLMAWLVWLQPWTIPVWSAGVLVFSLRFLWSCTQVAALRRHGEPAGEAVLIVIAGLTKQMDVTRPVRALISSLVDGPTVVGWIRPVILVPVASIFALTPQQLEAVLAHEMAHIRRYDFLVNVLQMLAEMLLFYHPAVWWTSARIRHERELCCDDLAVRSCGDALCYARALTQLERLRTATPAMALGSTGSSLSYRIQRLVGRAPQEHGASTLWRL
jgi:beta-lactamase regulating signal transducer with metallopeptidase domain